MQYEKPSARGTSLAMALLMTVNYGKAFLGSCITVVASFFAINTKMG